MGLVLQLLGPPRVSVDGAALDVDTRKAVALLAHLVVEDGPQPRDRLTELLWPEVDTSRGRSSLRRTLSTLRTALGHRWVTADRQVVTFESADATIDVWELRQAVARHDHARCPRCVPDLHAAVDAVRGEFLDGFTLRDSATFEAWHVEVAQSLRRTVDRAAALLAERQQEAGDHAAAAVTARRRVAADPLREDATRDLMIALAAAGDRAGAVEAYRALVAELDHELGVAPLEATRAVYDDLLRGSPPTPQLRPSPPRETHPRPQALQPPRLPCVGRDSELEVLLGRLASRRGAAILQGPMGMGVSRLLGELSDTLHDAGRCVLAAAATRGAAPIPYAVLHQALSPVVTDAATVAALPSSARSELARVFPALRPDGATEPVGTRAAFLGALAVLLRTLDPDDRGTALVLDDLQWMDAATAQTLAALLAMEELDLRVATGISGGLRSSQRAVRDLAAQLRPRAATLTLGPLEQADVLTLLGGHPHASREALAAQTGGVPLFVVEAARLPAGAEGSEVSEDLRGIVEGRVDALGGAAGQVLDAIATLDGSAAPAVLGEVSGRTPEETDLALEELVAAGLVVDDGRRVAMINEHIRRVVVQRRPAARTRLLHRRAAAALAGRGRAVTVARHHLAAGEDDAAAEWFVIAGEEAASLLAHTEAIAAFDAALAAGHPDRARLHRAIGDAAMLEGRYGVALQAYETALAVGTPDAATQHRIGRVHRRLGRWDLAAVHLQLAASLTTPGQPEAALVAADLAVVQNRRGQAEEARRWVEVALASSGDGDVRARAENAAALLADDPDARARHLRGALAAAEHPEVRAAVLNNLAGTVQDTDEAVRLAGRALEVAERVGDRHLLAVVANTLADCQHRAGAEEASRQALTRAVVLLADVTTDADGRDPAVWMLQEL